MRFPRGRLAIVVLCAMTILYAVQEQCIARMGGTAECSSVKRIVLCSCDEGQYRIGVDLLGGNMNSEGDWGRQYSKLSNASVKSLLKAIPANQLRTFKPKSKWFAYRKSVSPYNRAFLIIQWSDHEQILALPRKDVYVAVPKAAGGVYKKLDALAYLLIRLRHEAEKPKNFVRLPRTNLSDRQLRADLSKVKNAEPVDRGPW